MRWSRSAVIFRSLANSAGKIDDAKGGLPPAVDVAAVDRPIVVEELQILFVHLGPQLFQVDLVGRARTEQSLVEHAADLAVAVRVQDGCR